MIASTISGRIRVRSNKLKVAGVLVQLKKNIQVLEGVEEVRCNQIAGSLMEPCN